MFKLLSPSNETSHKITLNATGWKILAFVFITGALIALVVVLIKAALSAEAEMLKNSEKEREVLPTEQGEVQPIQNNSVQTEVVKTRAAVPLRQSEEGQKKSGLRIAVFIIFAVAAVGLIIFLLGGQSGAGKITRDASNSDIKMHVDSEFSLSLKLTTTPKEDITDLQITFSFLDNTKKTLTTKTKLLGNVKKDNDYSVTFSLNEFSFSEMMAISSVSAEVTGGKVDLF